MQATYIDNVYTHDLILFDVSFVTFICYLLKSIKCQYINNNNKVCVNIIMIMPIKITIKVFYGNWSKYINNHNNKCINHISKNIMP